TFMHSCDQKTTNFKDSPDYQKTQQTYAKQQGASVSKLGSAADSGGGGDSNCGGGQEVHMTMEDATADNVLGGETYQMRCVAVRNKQDQGSKSVVREIPLRLRHSGVQEDGNPLGPLGVLTKFFGAQAEYYYDTTYEKHDGALDQTKDARSEWVWHMNWKARLRRLRFGSDDSSSSSSSSSSSAAPSGCDMDSPSSSPDESYDKAAGGSDQGASSSQGGDDSGSGSVSTLKQIESLIIH
ncbi:MAG TPA: hypothetical protein VGI70_07940, partial [Polyangiales bacterium]